MIKLLQIARPQFLISGLALFVFGVSWAVLLGAPFSLARILFGYLVLMPAHLSISYSNDYFDVEVDKHDKPTLFSVSLLHAHIGSFVSTHLLDGNTRSRFTS